MEIYFVIVNGKQLEERNQDMGRVQPIKFYSRDEAENFIEDEGIDNAVVMSSVQWRDEIQHRIAMRNNK